jgi:hypothetical protein
LVDEEEKMLALRGALVAVAMTVAIVMLAACARSALPSHAAAGDSAEMITAGGAARQT